MDLEIKKKIENIVAKVAGGKTSEKMAVERLIQIMDNYADKAVMSFLELEAKNRGKSKKSEKSP